MSHQAKWEYLKAIHARYRYAPRPLKRQILDEFCHTTGYHRKYAIRLLNGPEPGRPRASRRQRRRPSANWSATKSSVHASFGFLGMGRLHLGATALRRLGTWWRSGRPSSRQRRYTSFLPPAQPSRVSSTRILRAP